MASSVHPEVAYLDPWDRQPEETDKQWEAFQTYRDIGYGRTYKRAAKELGVTVNTIYAYAKKNDWPERIQQWDIYEDRIYQAEKAQQLKNMGAKHAKLTQDAIEAMMAPINAMLFKAQDPEFKDQLLEYDFDELITHAQRSARVLERLMKAERLALDAPTEISSIQQNHTHTVNHAVDEETLDELAKLYHQYILPDPSTEGEDEDIVDAEVIEVQQD